MKQKHLTLEERETIESLLKDGLNFTEIGERINKHRTTISKEILNHRLKKEVNMYGRSYVHCNNRVDCENYQTKLCRTSWKDYSELTCELTEKPPYICNRCPKRTVCRFTKYYYRAKDANKEYKEFLTEARVGIRITQEEIIEINNIITPLIRDKNQSINHVYINHPDLLDFSKPTFYSYVDNNLFSFRNMDLLRKVTYKARKDNKRRSRAESIIRTDRTYEDYKNYVELNPNASIVEMDTVEGIKGGKVFLTLLFKNYNFMLIYLMEKQTMACVEEVFNKIKYKIGNVEFSRLFNIILTDNGSEFFNPISIETDYKTGEVLSRVFYCDPGASQQKGSLEKNHEFIRYVLPKSSSFNNLTQEKCNLLSNHINSTARSVLNNKTQYEAVQFLISEDIMEKLNISFIKPDEVNLSKRLLK